MTNAPYEVEIFQWIVDELITPLQASVGPLVASIVSDIATPVKVAAVLYVAVSGYQLLKGRGTADGAFGHMLRLLLVVWFSLDAAIYTTWVADLFQRVLPGDSGRIMTRTLGNLATLSANAFDGMWNQAYDAGLRMWALLSWRDIGQMIFILLFWGSAVMACGVGFLIWSLTFVIVAMLVVIGPFVIPLALFRATRSVFERWVGTLIQAVILQIFILILLALMVAVSGSMMAKVAMYTGTNPFVLMKTLFAAILLFGFSAFIAWRLPALAASLAGGLYFSPEGLVRGLAAGFAGAGSSAARGAQSAGRALAAESRHFNRSRIPPSTGPSLSRTP